MVRPCIWIMHSACRGAAQTHSDNVSRNGPGNELIARCGPLVGDVDRLVQRTMRGFVRVEKQPDLVPNPLDMFDLFQQQGLLATAATGSVRLIRCLRIATLSE